VKSEPVKTPIVDKNGKSTTVLKKPEDDITKTHPRLVKLMNTPSVFVDNDKDYAEAVAEVSDRMERGADSVASLIVGNRDRTEIQRLSDKMMAVLDANEAWQRVIAEQTDAAAARDQFVGAIKYLASGDITSLSPGSVEGYKLSIDYVNDIRTNEQD